MTHPVEPLTWVSALTTWQFSAWDVLVVLLAVPYLAGVAKCRRSGRPWPALRTLSFVAGLVTMVLAINSSLSAYSDNLFWIHMVQHLTLIMAVPVLLILGYPLSLWVATATPERQEARQRVLGSRAVGLCTHPSLTFVFYAVVLVGTHLTPFLQVRLENPGLQHVEIALYLLSGYLFFLPVAGGEPIRWQRFPHPLRVAILLAGMLPDTLVGVVLMIAGRPLAPAYALAHSGWGPTLLGDQALAGAIMWFFGDAAMAALALMAVRAWLRATGPDAGFGTWLESARRQALTRSEGDEFPAGAPALDDSHDVDSDERALAAYNAMLARLNNRDPQDPQRRSDGRENPE